MDPLAPFDFELPDARIALRPVEPQDQARLLVVHGDGRLDDRHMLDLPTLLQPGETLVFNDTRVIPAALTGTRPARDANGQDVAVDVNLVRPVSESQWRALARPGKRLKPGDRLVFAQDFDGTILEKYSSGEIVIAFSQAGDALAEALDTHGNMPLPPYIARRRAADRSDRDTYQTEFAGAEAKSVAAPTAGLHFTPRLLEALDAAGIARQFLRLHVGLGTFAPLNQDQLESGRLHAEWCSLSEPVAAQLNQVRQAGHKCVAVGTTALRTLESAAQLGDIAAYQGDTDIFIQPGYRFRATDGLLTNFHLPRSSLFMLVCALMGTDIMQAAYAHAIESDYRFYSYGDACLLLPD